jgi:LysM repeat protein
MNTPNPFDSQKTASEQINKSRARLRLAVFAAFGVSLLVLVPLLVQGCKRQEETPPPVAEDTNAPVAGDTNLPPSDLTHTNLVLPPLAPVGTNTMMPVAPPVEVTAPPVTSSTEYVVTKGDSFYTIGKKFGVSTKAIGDANPGVVSTKLKVGQKLNVPAAAVAHENTAVVGVPEAAGSESSYVVKSGDTLMKIAKQHGITYKAIKTANGLTTDKIKVGQKLKIPVKEAAAIAAPVAAPAVEPAPAAIPVLPPPTTPAAPIK